MIIEADRVVGKLWPRGKSHWHKIISLASVALLISNETSQNYDDVST